jgi:hemerythrin-like domain-containing protein
MNIQRFNLFNRVHKGLRGFLYNVGLTIQQTDFANPQAVETIEKLQQLMHFFDKHANVEDQFILPHVSRHNEALVNDMEKDHEVDHRLIQELQDQIDVWKNATQEDKKVSAGRKIFYAFNEFIAFNLYHMNREENELMYTMWQHMTDDGIREIEQQIIQSINPEVLFEECRWIMRSISNTEIIEWLAGVKMHAPAPVYFQLCTIGTEELPAERWAVIQEALCEVAIA